MNKKKETHYSGIEPAEGKGKSRNRVYVGKQKTLPEILELIDSLCTKCYGNGDMETFRELNKIYHELKRIDTEKIK